MCRTLGTNSWFFPLAAAWQQRVHVVYRLAPQKRDGLGFFFFLLLGGCPVISPAPFFLNCVYRCSIDSIGKPQWGFLELFLIQPGSIVSFAGVTTRYDSTSGDARDEAAGK